MKAAAALVAPAARQHVFPPPLERNYRIEDGRIRTRSLEAHIVDHCNLSCAECCSLSPLLPAWQAEPASVAHDLKLAARVLAPAVFKLVGGEPLLHSRLLEVIDAVRASGIAPRLSLTTNGLKLGEMPDDFWRAVDALTISRYPRPRLSDALVAHIEAQAARHAVQLNWKIQDTFTSMTRTPASDDAAAIGQLFHDCWLRERCHIVRDGVFYTCTRPPHFHTLHGGAQDYAADGLRLHEGAGLAEQMLAYLQRETPLQACFHCHGGSAPLAPHRIMKRAEVQAWKAIHVAQFGAVAAEPPAATAPASPAAGDRPPAEQQR